jgi:hypothetical protein
VVMSTPGRVMYVAPKPQSCSLPAPVHQAIQLREAAPPSLLVVSPWVPPPSIAKGGTFSFSPPESLGGSIVHAVLRGVVGQGSIIWTRL